MLLLLAQKFVTSYLVRFLLIQFHFRAIVVIVFISLFTFIILLKGKIGDGELLEVRVF